MGIFHQYLPTHTQCMTKMYSWILLFIEIYVKGTVFKPGASTGSCLEAFVEEGSLVVVGWASCSSPMARLLLCSTSCNSASPTCRLMRLREPPLLGPRFFMESCYAWNILDKSDCLYM